MRNNYLVCALLFIFGTSCNDIRVTNKNENEIQKIEGTWVLKSKKVIYSYPNFENLLPEKLTFILNPCSFKGSNNLCFVKFKIDDYTEKESSFRLSTNVNRNSVIAMQLDINQAYAEKEKLFNQSYLEITDKSSNTLNLKVKSTNITYDMVLVKP